MQIAFKIHKQFSISRNSQPNSKVSKYFRESSVLSREITNFVAVASVQGGNTAKTTSKSTAWLISSLHLISKTVEGKNTSECCSNLSLFRFPDVKHFSMS